MPGCGLYCFGESVGAYKLPLKKCSIEATILSDYCCQVTVIQDYVNEVCEKSTTFEFTSFG